MLARIITSLSLVIVSCSADNCGTGLGAAYQLMSTLPQYCAYGADANTCSDSGGCSCRNCCEETPGTCQELNGKSGTVCSGDKTYDSSKADTVVSAEVEVEPAAETQTSFQEKCCTTDTTCYDVMAKGTSCATTHVVPSAKRLTAVAETDFSTTCCETKVKCDTHTCRAGMTLKSTAATLECSSIPCSNSFCCDDDSTTCYGLQSTANNCGDQIFDYAKAGVAASAADFKEKCCSPKVTCEAFKASTAITKKASGAMKQSAAILLFLAIIGLVA